jgi:hypothetical protein
MEFLDAGFCSMTSGADYVNSKDTNLIREKWRCRYSTAVDVALTDLSVYGETIERICGALIEKRIRDNMSSAELGKLMLHMHSMGMEAFAQENRDRFKMILMSDSDFSSLCRFTASVKNLAVMYRIRYGNCPGTLREYISVSYERALYLMESVRTPDDDSVESVCRDIYQLYSFGMEYSDICGTDELCSAINSILASDECNSMVYGVMSAILYKCGKYSSDEFGQLIGAYLSTAGENDIAMFLRGVFTAARDILFSDDRILVLIDDIVSSMSDEKFSVILPNLRYAFTNFIPSETERISKMISSKYGTSEELLAGSGVFSFDDVSRAGVYDKKAAECLKKWGFV